MVWESSQLDIKVNNTITLCLYVNVHKVGLALKPMEDILWSLYVICGDIAHGLSRQT